MPGLPLAAGPRPPRGGPLPGCRNDAFSGDVEAGVQYRPSAERALSAGIRLHHISNADTGDTNPGLNALVIFVGLSAYR